MMLFLALIYRFIALISHQISISILFFKWKVWGFMNSSSPETIIKYISRQWVLILNPQILTRYSPSKYLVYIHNGKKHLNGDGQQSHQYL